MGDGATCHYCRRAKCICDERCQMRKGQKEQQDEIERTCHLNGKVNQGFSMKEFTIKIKVTREEQELLAAAANKAGVSTAEWVRLAALLKAARNYEPVVPYRETHCD